MTIAQDNYTATVGAATLSVRGGRLSLDASRAPHVECTLDCAFPTQAVYELLDPRMSPPPRVVLTATDGAITRYFDMHVRDRLSDKAPGVLTVKLASDEALVSDTAPLINDTAPLALAASLRAVVNYVLAKVGAHLEATPAIDVDVTPDAEREEESLTWRAGIDGLRFLAPILQAAGLRLVCDEARKWTLRNEAYLAAGALTLRQGVNLTGADERIGRDQGLWFDGRVTRYRWTDSAGVQQERIDAFALTATPSRVTLLDIDAPYPGRGRSEYAVRRAQGAGREVTVVARAQWTAKAEQPSTIRLDDAPTQTGKLRNVEFDLGKGLMTVTGRTTDTPEHAWTLQPTGPWTDGPVNESWMEAA